VPTATSAPGVLGKRGSRVAYFAGRRRA